MEHLKKDGWEYLIKDGAAIITRVPSNGTAEIIVPETIDSYPVEEVMFYFASLYGYETLILPKTLKRFEPFCLSETIKSIKIDPENRNFAVIDDVIYSKDLKTLVYFPSCKKVFSPDCLNGVEIIAAGAFSYCNCIKDLVLPESVSEIHDFAFSSCEGITNVVMPDSVNKVGKAVFAHSTLQSITLSKNIKELEASFDCDGEGEGFFQNSKLEKIMIPEGIEKIGYLTFSGCQKLKTIFIPASVKTIENYAFHECESLENIVVSEDNAFFYSNEGVLYSRSSQLLLYPMNKSDRSFAVPNGIIEIHELAFYKTRHLKQLLLGDSISKIGYRAFACSSIETVNIPEKVNSIDLDVFLYCQVKELYFPKGIQYIEMNSNTSGNINPYRDMTILVDKDSYAERMCIQYNLKYLTVNNPG